jgi:hypothetical protein
MKFLGNAICFLAFLVLEIRAFKLIEKPGLDSSDWLLIVIALAVAGTLVVNVGKGFNGQNNGQEPTVPGSGKL